jgi:hypothetical protein
VSYAKPEKCILDLNHISIRIFHQTRPSSATQPYCGARRLCGEPHKNRLLKAIAGSGFDAILCADVYNQQIFFTMWGIWVSKDADLNVDLKNINLY